MMLTDLATAVRRSGLPVVEVAGWRSRTRPGGMSSVESIVMHHTATSDSARGDYPSMGIVKNGRPDLDGPLAQLGLGRSGTVYVIAAGRANHAGRTWLRRQSNAHAIGIECEASGAHAITGAQLDAYCRLVKALCDHYKIPIAHVQSHAEVAVPHGRKNDVRNPMGDVRSRIAACQCGPVPTPAPPRSSATGGKYLTITGQLNDGTVRVLQRWVGSGVDGKLGPATTKALQAKLGVSADGVFGANSARALEKVLDAPATTVPGWYPGLIRALQRYFNGLLAAGKL